MPSKLSLAKINEPIYKMSNTVKYRTGALFSMDNNGKTDF